MINLAHENGVTHLSITDHDTLAAYATSQTYQVPQGMTLIPGIELSATYSNRCIHILGLNVDPHSEALNQVVQSQTQLRQDRAKRISEKLAQLGIENTYQEAKALALDEPGRPHFAQVLLNKGVCQTQNSAFNLYLADNKAAFVKQDWPTMAQVTQSITATGGIAVIAHPTHYKMTRSKICRMVEAFQAAGGQGIELLNGRQAPHVTQSIQSIAKQYELLISVGSDFHSPTQCWLKLGMHRTIPKGCAGVWDSF